MPRTGGTATEGGLESGAENSIVVDGGLMNQIVSVDPYNVAIRNFYLVKLVAKNGKIQPQVVKTFPKVSQFWIFPPKIILNQPIFSKDFPK